MPESHSSAIHFHPDAFTLPEKKILGRQSAGSGFLNAFLRYTSSPAVFCYAQSSTHFEKFGTLAKQFGRPADKIEWIPLHEQARLANVGCLYHPEPTLAHLAWNRRCVGSAAYSLCGVTHTICSSGAMQSIADLLVAPTQTWDALVCTSAAAKSAIKDLLAAWSGYLQERLEANFQLPLQLPVIPLGVHCDRFEPKSGDEALRADLRRQLEIAADDVAILFVGRLSYHAKAHPLPMYRALEAAAKRTSKRLHVLHFGWFANQALQRDFVTAARVLCPSVRAVFLDGSQPGLFERIWLAADIFTSLADNIQETFGLTPLEAMAAGLPVVVSDWDGYRDTVRHDTDGFRVPTLMPPAGCGSELAKRYSLGIDNYDRYVGHVSQMVAVDVASCTAAYLKLIENHDLRRAMGEAGRQRAQAQFDWRHVIRAYEELWAELALRRAAAKDSSHKNPPQQNPLRADPFGMFAGYATRALDADCEIALSPGAPIERLPELRAMPIANFAVPVMSTLDECREVLQYIGAQGSCTVAEILAQIPAERRTLLHGTLGWLAKMDLVRPVDVHVSPIGE